MTAGRDPREVAEVFGNVWATTGGILSVGMPNTEADLRRNLATVAHLFGWLVEEEVVVPGWGRIDIIIRDGLSAPILIELKLDLTKPAKIRRAFQQTDGYGRWWTQAHGEAVDTILIGRTVDENTMTAVQRAYPQVGWCTAGQLLSVFCQRGEEAARKLRRARVRQRRSALHGLVLAHDAALKDLPPDPVTDVLGAFNLFQELTNPGAGA